MPHTKKHALLRVVSNAFLVAGIGFIGSMASFQGAAQLLTGPGSSAETQHSEELAAQEVVHRLEAAEFHAAATQEESGVALELLLGIGFILLAFGLHVFIVIEKRDEKVEHHKTSHKVRKRNVIELLIIR